MPGFSAINLAIASTLCIAAWAQQAADPYSTGMTLLSNEGCPVFVGGTVKSSPAEHGGIRPGDQIQAVGGTSVTDSSQTAKLLQSDEPRLVTVRLKRNGKTFEAVLMREKRSVIFARSGEGWRYCAPEWETPR